MKNDLHLAYRTNQNFPLHISSPDGVREHLADNVRLIAMLPGEWPKVRGRTIARKSYTVENTFEVLGHKVEHITIDTDEIECSGRLIDGKYFLTDSVLNHSMDLELILTPFDDIDAKPMVRREWSWDYPSSHLSWYSLVDKSTEEYEGVETYYPILGCDKVGINNILDLLAYSYKFAWDADRQVFDAITDPHEITLRLRKPWMQYLVQWRFGEAPATEADLSKLVSFLLTKVELSEEEKTAVSAIAGRSVSLEDLTRINARHVELDKLLAAYHSDFVLAPGCKFEDDPMFAIY